MRNRLVRGLVLLAVTLGVAVGAASTAGATDLSDRSIPSAGIIWD